MNIDTTYEPKAELEDHFFPIDKTVWHIEAPAADPKMVVEKFKEELAQKRVPAQAPVYAPPSYMAPDCYVEKATAIPSWSRKQDASCEVDHDSEYHVLHRIKHRMEKIEKIDRRTLGLYYGALDVWYHITTAVDNIAGVFNAMRTLAVARVRWNLSQKFSHIAETLNNEQKKNRKT